MIDKRHLDKWECISKIGDWEYCKLKKDYKYSPELTIIHEKEPLNMTKEIFDLCPFKDKIFKNYDVEMVVLGGSCLYEVFDDISDYDIDVYIPTSQIQPITDECIFYKNRKLHWYYQSIEHLISSESLEDIMLSVCLNYLDINKIIYIKQNSVEYKKLLNNKNDICMSKIYTLLSRYYNVLSLANNNELSVADLNTKPLGLVGICYYIINKLPIDKDVIITLKRCRYSEISDEIFEKIKYIFSFLYKYYIGDTEC